MAKHYLQSELEALFREDDSMWSFVQRGSLDGVWYWDLEKPDNEWMSPEMWQLFGIDPDTKQHDPAEWQDIIFEEDLKLALENFEKHCADPNHPYDQLVRYRHVDGSTVWVRCRGMAIRDQTGKPIRMLGAHNDFTPVKRAEEAALVAEREMAAANRELNSFAYSTSHDLKSPSNTVAMILNEVIEADEGGLSADQRALLDMARDTVDHMRNLVDGLLSYTRLIGEELQWERVHLGEIARGMEKVLAAAFEASQGTLVVNTLPELPVNRLQITMMFQNLIENSLKFRHPKRPPVITFETLASDDPAYIDISVSDNGIGIAPEHQDCIFDLFKRLHRADEVEGSGLGLTMCRRVAMNHGGDIRVTSDEGAGTTFTLSLPRYQQ